LSSGRHRELGAPGLDPLVYAGQFDFHFIPDGRLLSVIGFTIAGGKVVEMDILADPDRLSRLDLSAIEP
jgi:hypothetical protein